MKTRVHVTLHGRVQGVGFRAWAKEKSSKLSLSGWVRKASDGSIEIFVQGKEEELNDFASLCWDGPSMTYIDDVLIHDANIDKTLTDFKIY